MTKLEIQSLQPGDSIIGAFDQWDDEYPIEEVQHDSRGTQLRVRVSKVLALPYFVFPNGPEIRGIAV